MPDHPDQLERLLRRAINAEPTPGHLIDDVDRAIGQSIQRRRRIVAAGSALIVVLSFAVAWAFNARPQPRTPVDEALVATATETPAAPVPIDPVTVSPAEGYLARPIQTSRTDVSIVLLYQLAPIAERTESPDRERNES